MVQNPTILVTGEDADRTHDHKSNHFCAVALSQSGSAIDS